MKLSSALGGVTATALSLLFSHSVAVPIGSLRSIESSIYNVDSSRNAHHKFSKLKEQAPCHKLGDEGAGNVVTSYFKSQSNILREDEEQGAETASIFENLVGMDTSASGAGTAAATKLCDPNVKQDVGYFFLNSTTGDKVKIRNEVLTSLHTISNVFSPDRRQCNADLPIEYRNTSTGSSSQGETRATIPSCCG